jgi:hypothetical protein
MRQPVDKPGLRHRLHPCPHQGDELACKKQAVVAMAENGEKAERRRWPRQRFHLLFRGRFADDWRGNRFFKFRFAHRIRLLAIRGRTHVLQKELFDEADIVF